MPDFNYVLYSASDISISTSSSGNTLPNLTGMTGAFGAGGAGQQLLVTDDDSRLGSAGQTTISQADSSDVVLDATPYSLTDVDGTLGLTAASRLEFNTVTQVNNGASATQTTLYTDQYVAIEESATQSVRDAVQNELGNAPNAATDVSRNVIGINFEATGPSGTTQWTMNMVQITNTDTGTSAPYWMVAPRTAGATTADLESATSFSNVAYGGMGVRGFTTTNFGGSSSLNAGVWSGSATPFGPPAPPPPCFTENDMILTPNGRKRIADLKAGDLVITKDKGAQPVRWIYRAHVSEAKMRAQPALSPVTFRKGCLGGGMPAQDLTVSPGHMMYIADKDILRFAGIEEAIVPAVFLTGLEGVSQAPAQGGVTYVHILLERHHLLDVNGAWSESFRYGRAMRILLPKVAVEEIETLFPEVLAMENPIERFPAVRPALYARKAKRAGRRVQAFPFERLQ